MRIMDVLTHLNVFIDDLNGLKLDKLFNANDLVSEYIVTMDDRLTDQLFSKMEETKQLLHQLIARIYELENVAITNYAEAVKHVSHWMDLDLETVNIVASVFGERIRSSVKVWASGVIKTDLIALFERNSGNPHLCKMGFKVLSAISKA